MQSTNVQLRSARRFVLQTFAATGRSPSLADIQRRFHLASPDEADTLVRDLETAGSVHRNPGDAAITHAYPFSNEPTAHRVQLAGGPEVYAMCAIDALGMPYMLKQDASVASVCEHCGSHITVRVERQQVVSRSPSDIVVWYAAAREGCVVATDLCPSLNFFCSAAHLGMWRAAHAHADGRMLNFEQAVEAGRKTFENMMEEGSELRLEP
jgi:hypothetical protein